METNYIITKSVLGNYVNIIKKRYHTVYSIMLNELIKDIIIMVTYI